MSSMSDFLENAIADHIFRGTPLPQFTALYIALFTTAPTDAGGGNEVTGAGYARINLPPSDTNWLGTHGTTVGPSSGTGGRVGNALTITFGAPTADWGIITHYKVMDALTGGNMLFHGALTIPQTVNNGNTPPEYPVNAFGMTFD